MQAAINQRKGEWVEGRFPPSPGTTPAADEAGEIWRCVPISPPLSLRPFPQFPQSGGSLRMGRASLSRLGRGRREGRRRARLAGLSVREMEYRRDALARWRERYARAAAGGSLCGGTLPSLKSARAPAFRVRLCEGQVLEPGQSNLVSDSWQVVKESTSTVD